MNQTKFLLVGFCLILAGCSNSAVKQKDTATSGELAIAVDESFKPIIKELANSYMFEYPKTKIRLMFLPEGDCINLLMKDSVREIVISRDLSSEEKNYYKNLGYQPAIVPIAVDALAFVINPNNFDSTITYSQIEQILSGNIDTWNVIDKKLQPNKIDLVFDGNNSSSLRYLKDSVNQGKPLPSNCFAADSSEAVINYINQHPYSIGVIGVNWINSKLDSTTESDFKKVKMLKVKPLPGMPGDSSFHAPVPYNIAYRHYPFLRIVYIVSREYYTGLGTGFATYCATDKGQTLIARSGMLPVNKELRLVTINPNL